MHRNEKKIYFLEQFFIFLNSVSDSYGLTVNSFGNACAKLFVDEESTWHKSNRGKTKTLTDSIRKRHKKENSVKLCVKNLRMIL
jgi:hypothetical protein